MAPRIEGKNPEQGPIRCAIYARYSSDMQRPTSIDDQIRECKDAAARNGWAVLEQYIRGDEALSGETTGGRDGLEELIALAQQKPRPFDYILMDDTSRFGRNLSDTLPMSDILEYSGVSLFFANRRLDSRDPNFRVLFVSYGQQDEQFSRGTGEKVHRGQRGRVLNGFISTGRAYGYKNVPVEHPTRKGVYGRPYVESVRLEINPQEAAVVVRIFEESVRGDGHRHIAKRLNAEGVPSPLQGQSSKRRQWNAGAIRAILKNDKYRGVHIWNKTKLVRNPIAKRKEQQPRPESEWERVDVPSWRIVPQELWDAAQEEATRRARSWRQEGGLNRTPTSRQYLFSGLMVCAECGSNFNIIDGKVSSLRYGCIGHRYRGTCQNKLTILRRTLEEQMLQALKDNILRPEIRVQLCADFHAQVRVAWEQSRQQSRALAADSETLRQRQRQLQDQADNLVDAIAKTGGSSLIYERLQSVELQLNQVAQLLTLSTEVKQDAPNAEEIQGFFERVFAELDSVMTAEPELAKQTLRKYMGKLVMRAIPSATSPKYEVSGDLRLFASEASQDTVLLEGSVHRTMQQYEDWRVPFFTVLNAKSTRQRNRSRVDGRFLSDVDEGSDDAEELGGMNAAPWNEDVPSQTYLIAGMETSNNLVSSLLE